MMCKQHYSDTGELDWIAFVIITLALSLSLSWLTAYPADDEITVAAGTQPVTVIISGNSSP